jgi:putative ubiquitin-RnfH superfamily antitoxin RatB of RatAB toxin-antitoxin module
MEPDATVACTVIYARPGSTPLIDVRVPAGATLRDAIIASGVLALAPELALDALEVGVFNRPRALDSSVCDGDRIEIYRPLKIDPKETRRVRAAIRKRRKGMAA